MPRYVELVVVGGKGLKYCELSFLFNVSVINPNPTLLSIYLSIYLPSLSVHTLCSVSAAYLTTTNHHHYPPQYSTTLTPLNFAFARGGRSISVRYDRDFLPKIGYPFHVFQMHLPLSTRVQTSPGSAPGSSMSWSAPCGTLISTMWSWRASRRSSFSIPVGFCF